MALDDAEGYAADVFEHMREEPEVFLVPEFDDAASAQPVLEVSWPELFARMLEAWSTDEAAWPADRSLQTFMEWFEIQYFPIVSDVDDDGG